MAEYEKKVRKVLLDNGWRFHRHGKGDHDIWIDPENKRTVPVDGKIKDRHLANTVMKQAGIKHHF